MSYSYNFWGKFPKEKTKMAKNCTKRQQKGQQKRQKQEAGVKRIWRQKGSRHISHVLPSHARSANTHVPNMNEYWTEILALPYMYIEIL